MTSDEMQGLVMEIVMAQKRIGVLLGKIEKFDDVVKTSVDLRAAITFVSHPIEIPAAWAAHSHRELIVELIVEDLEKRAARARAYDRALIIANQLAPPCPTCSVKTHVDTDSGTRERPGADIIDGQWFFTCPKGHGGFIGMLTETKLSELEEPT